MAMGSRSWDVMPLTPREEQRLRSMTSRGEVTEMNPATVGEWRSLWTTLDLARVRAKELADGEISYDPSRMVVSIRGTQFALLFFDHLRENSGEDECYQHQRDGAGNVSVTRTHGHRETIALLRACLGARPQLVDVPEPESRMVWQEWDESARLTLAATPAEIVNEASLVEMLIRLVDEFRKTTNVTEMTLDAHARQLGSAGRMFAVLERVKLARARLFLHGEPFAPASSPLSSPEIPAGESRADAAASAPAGKEQDMGKKCDRCMGPIEGGRCLSCGAEFADQGAVDPAEPATGED